MSLLLDALRALGVGGNLLVAAILGLAGFYLFRGKRYAGTAAAATGSAAIYGIVVLVALSVSIALGWLEPNPGLITDALGGVVEFGGDLVTGIVRWTLERALEGMA